MKDRIKAAIRRLGYDIRKVEHLPQVEAQGAVVAWPWAGRTIRFYVENRFDLIGRDMFNGRFFEAEELDFLRTIADPSGAFLDVGANVGNHTVYFAAVIGAAQVLAFEPGDFAYPRLAFNVALNDLNRRVTLHRMALSNRDGEASMHLTYADNHGSLSISEGQDGTQLVPVARGDTLVGDTHVTFIKVDVERHEFEVLAGLSGVIARDRPLVMVEVMVAERARFDAWLAAQGYASLREFPRYGDIVNVVAGPAR